MKDLFQNYYREREGCETLVNESGTCFLTYKPDSFNGVQGLYIVHLYTHHLARKSGVASELADEVLKIAKEKEIKKIYGSVSMADPNRDTNIKVLFGYKMKILGMGPNDMIIFERDVE